MTEPDVTLTDYALTLECTVFVFLLYIQGNPQQSLRPWFVVFFTMIGFASLCGGTVHGFFLHKETKGYKLLWPATLLAIGVTAFAAWVIGATLQFSEAVVKWCVIIATIECVVYSLIVVFISRRFLVAILNYLPATIFMLTMLTAAYQRLREPSVLAGAFGLVLTFVAAGIQQAKIGVHPVYFTHNALYHVIQAIALLMLYWSACWLVMQEG